VVITVSEKPELEEQEGKKDMKGSEGIDCLGAPDLKGSSK